MTGLVFQWASDNTDAVTVSSAGLVTAVSPGHATITATSGGKSASASVQVSAPSSVSVASVQVSPSTASLVVGQSRQFIATTLDASGNALSGRVIAWTATPATAIVSATGFLTAIAAGTAQVTATSEGKSGVSTATISAATTAPTLALSATSVAFSGTVGGPNPISQAVTVTNVGGGSLTGLSVLAPAYGSGQPTGWLSPFLSSTTAPATLTLAVTTGPLIAGVYTATLSVASTANGVSNSPVTISVSLTVASAGPTLLYSQNTDNSGTIVLPPNGSSNASVIIGTFTTGGRSYTLDSRASVSLVIKNTSGFESCGAGYYVTISASGFAQHFASANLSQVSADGAFHSADGSFSSATLLPNTTYSVFLHSQCNPGGATIMSSAGGAFFGTISVP
jgi:trimeric autotransporter adhesin